MVGISFMQSFVRFMRGRQPQTIVTDIDSGLRDAIASEMPNTKHVICIWQVLSKLSSWFSSPLGLQYPDFKSEFDMLCRLENVEDFEHQWNQLVARFGLGSDKHIALLLSYRASWPISYMRNFFLARTMTIEYWKLVETFMKNILTPQSSLLLFFEQVQNSYYYLTSLLLTCLVHGLMTNSAHFKHHRLVWCATLGIIRRKSNFICLLRLACLLKNMQGVFLRLMPSISCSMRLCCLCNMQ